MQVNKRVVHKLQKKCETVKGKQPKQSIKCDKHKEIFVISCVKVRTIKCWKLMCEPTQNVNIKCKKSTQTISNVNHDFKETRSCSMDIISDHFFSKYEMNHQKKDHLWKRC